MLEKNLIFECGTIENIENSYWYQEIATNYHKYVICYFLNAWDNVFDLIWWLWFEWTVPL